MQQEPLFSLASNESDCNDVIGRSTGSTSNNFTQRPINKEKDIQSCTETVSETGLRIYPTQTSKGLMWAVQLPSNRGSTRFMGDELVNSKKEGLERAEYLEKKEIDDKNRLLECERIEKESLAKELADKARRNDLNGFAEDKSRIAKVRIVETLNKSFMHKGVVKTRKEIVDELLASGYRVTSEETSDIKATNKARERVSYLRTKAPQGNQNHHLTKELLDLKNKLERKDFKCVERALSLDDSSYDEKTITKTGMDYAFFIQSKL